MAPDVKASVEMMSGAVWVGDRLEQAGWVEVADARKVKALAPLAIRDMVPRKRVSAPGARDACLGRNSKAVADAHAALAFGAEEQWVSLALHQLFSPISLPVGETYGELP